MGVILLVHVPVGFEEAYPLALAAIAAPVRAAGFRVEGLDAARAGLEGLRRRLGVGDVTVVGLSAWSPGLAAARQTIATIRSAAPRATLVVGGPHPTLAPNDLDADVVVVGEGEATFLDVVIALAAGRSAAGIPGTIVDGVSGADRAALDLGAVALPDRIAFRVADYHRDHNPRGRRYAAVVTSRGCLHHCAYCSSPRLWGRGHRVRPDEQVVDEWTRLRQDHGVDGLLVEDDLFTQRPARVESLCEALLRRPPGVTWELINGVRPETLTGGLPSLMARAGCSRIALSLETGDPTRLAALGRGADPARVARSVAAVRAAGIGVTGYFLIGLPGETSRDRLALFDYAAGLGLDMAHFSNASAWPGTSFDGPLAPAPPLERAALYARWYAHPVRARRAARMLGVGVKDLPRMGHRLLDWMARPLEARQARLS